MYDKCVIVNRNIEDSRSVELKKKMGTHFDEYEADYRSEDWCSIVYEDDEVIVVADHAGYEFNEWVKEVTMSRAAFSEIMHNFARQLCDYDWCESYPLVFDRIE